MKPIHSRLWWWLFAFALAVAGCAGTGAKPQMQSFSALVEGNDTSGMLVRIQTQNDPRPRVVTVPFQEQWRWNQGCYRATIQRTVASAEDAGEMSITFKINDSSPEVRKTALLMGAVDVSLCYEDDFFRAR
jgi:hypothetical protein